MPELGRCRGDATVNYLPQIGWIMTYAFYNKTYQYAKVMGANNAHRVVVAGIANIGETPQRCTVNSERGEGTERSANRRPIPQCESPQNPSASGTTRHAPTAPRRARPSRSSH